jgi:peptidoglycan hydrolase-like protein with peptidoglycan-binding domain
MTQSELLAKIQEITNLIKQLQLQIQQLSQPTPTQTPTFSIPQDYSFTTVLKYGMQGLAVRYLQIFLSSQGPEIYPEGSITGYFGNLTKQAVIRFQLKYNLITSADSPVAGLVGPATRGKINELMSFQ